MSKILKVIIVAIIAIVVSYAILSSAGLLSSQVGYFTAMANASASVLVKIGIAAGFASGVANGLLNGASLGESLLMGVKGAIFGGLSAGLAHGIGTVFAKDALMRAISHGVVRGILGRAQGGNFGNGFMSGFASSALGNITKGLKNMHTAMKLSFHALVGGTVSAIGGGKFANGAVSAAVVYLFNDHTHEGNSENLVKDWLTGSGPRMRVYGPENSMTKDLSTDPAIEYFKNKFLTNYGSIGDAKYYAVKFGITDFFFANTNTLANIGSYGLSIYQTGSNELTYVISNDMGFNSFTAGIFPNIDSGPMSTIETWFWWKGSIK